MKRRPWTEPEDRVMREFYPKLRGIDLAEVLKRTTSSVFQRAKKLGLEKSPEFLASDLSGRVQRGKQHPNMIASQFQKGQTSWNKGLKGVVGVQDACRATQFKKGRPAHEARNYKPIGSLRINADGILERKVTDDPNVYPARRWVPVARLVWEAANGPIPAGHVVRFKQGLATTVPELVTLERLECISRVENMRRNSVHTVYPPEVARLAQLRGALNRQINKRAKEAA
jgi:hypothetical protein